ncbi:hypothetical protein RRG08_027355 [Elysia crispata]|uniref:C2H2-type domain-containing protein n=1 Tax=Elysia crispata TaxID=231223 RepID=A0AAE1D0U8_9GAST|nr:hypothetical protein RRG08_027355 [Elysia crispata]
MYMINRLTKVPKALEMSRPYRYEIQVFNSCCDLDLELDLITESNPAIKGISMAETSILQMWSCFYNQFQSSKTLTQDHENDDALIQTAGTSLLLDTGKSFAFDLLKSLNLLAEDVVKFNYILWKLEEKCLPQVVVKFENFKRSSGESDASQNDTQPGFIAQALPIAETNTVVDILNEDLTNTPVKDSYIPCNRVKSSSSILSNTLVKTESSGLQSQKTFVKCNGTGVTHDSSSEQGNIPQTSVRRSGRSVKISTRFQDVEDKILKTIKGEALTGEVCLESESYSLSKSQSSLGPELIENKRKVKSKQNEKIDGNIEVSNSLERSCPLCHTVLENDQSLETHLQVHIDSSTLYSCDHCNEMFSNLGSLRKHLLSHLGMSVKHPLCLFCGKTFKFESLLEVHIRKKHGKYCNSFLFQCTKCPKTFRSKSQLDFHSVRHADVKPYSCTVCGKNFMREKGLINHMQMHEGGGYMCAVCGKSFVSQRVLEDHCTIHTGEKPHVCDVCGKSFRLRANLRNHKQVHSTNKGIQCSKCPKSFRDMRSYNRHMLMHTGERPWRCAVCGKGFVQEVTLKKHMNLHNGENLHQCKVCLRSFVDKWGLMKHSTIHTGERPYECNVCHKTFRIKRGLEDHMKLHDVSLQLSCPLCPKTFVEKRHLDHHLRVHRGEKAYVCEICGDRFVNSMSLKVHLRRHTGEKPYKCSYCPKTFNQHGTHAAHERYHRGERPYACEYCNAAFITHSQLNIHRRKHLNIRPYKCTQCDYAATTASLLKVHSLKHSNEKPFRCPVCPAAFKRQNHLDVHARKHQTREEVVVGDDNTNIIHISSTDNGDQSEIVEPGTVTVVEVFQCSFCQASFTTQSGLEKHMKRHEIIVVTAAANQDGIFEIPTIEGAHGASSEVAYDIVLL